jgi:hypothetical protein
MDGPFGGTAPFAPRKPTKSKPARTTVRNSGDNPATLQYFTQILDIDTVCSNALRNLRADDQQHNKWLADVQKDEWMFKYNVPIRVKY